jgi:hypothetical protein
MLSNWIRTLHNDNGTITDYSLQSSDRTSTFTLPIISGEDYLYIGQYFPFNNLYFSVSTANTNACTIAIEYWDNGWTSAVDIIDATSESGKSMAQSGVVQWEIDRDDNGWNKIYDPTNESSSLGFNTKKIYDLYWIRVSFSADLSAGSLLKKIGYRFCTDADLTTKAPEIDNYLTSWGDGTQTDWEMQCIEASEQILIDLKSKGIAAAAGQILRFDEIHTACAYKTIALIYDGIRGEDALIERDKKNETYRQIINSVPIKVDLNENAALEREEIGITQGRLYR